MSIALKGLIAGFATGIGEAMDEERKETKQRIAVRTKNAYENYVKYQEQTNALKEEIRKRDAEARQFQPDLNDEERVAIATMPNAIDLYKRALAEGRSVGDRTITLRDILKVGDKAKGMKYDDFVNALGKVEPVQQVMMEPKTSFFGTSPEKQRRLMETMAGTVGVPAEQLMAFERPKESPRVEPMGALDIETMFKKEEEKKIKTPTERLQERLSLASGYAEEYGNDSPEAIAARQLYEEEKERQETLNPSQLKFADMVNAAQIKRVETLRKYGENSPQHKAAVKELKDIQGKEEESGGSLTPDQARKMIVNAGANAVSLKHGTNASVAVSTDQFGNKTVEYRGDPTSVVSKEIRATQLAAIARQVRPYLDASGRPISAVVRDALTEVQVPFDNNGRPIFDVVSPPSTTTAAPAGGVGGAQRVTPPTTPTAAQSSPVAPQVAPVVRPGAAAVPTAPTAASAVIPPGAIDMLKKNPKLAPDFDEKYGPGSAARILGSR